MKKLDRKTFIIGSIIFALFGFINLTALYNHFILATAEDSLSINELKFPLIKFILCCVGSLFCAHRAKKYQESSSKTDSHKSKSTVISVILFPLAYLFIFGSGTEDTNSYVVIFGLLLLFLCFSLLLFVLRGSKMILSLDIEKDGSKTVASSKSLTQGAALAALSWILLLPLLALINWFYEANEKWNDGFNFVLTVITSLSGLIGIFLIISIIIGSFIKNDK